MKRMRKHAGNVYAIVRQRRLLRPMIADVLRGRYRLSVLTLLVLLSGLVYILFPFDLLPDFIPLIGWIDDGIWTYLLLKQLRREAERYGRWRQPADLGNPSLFLKPALRRP